jgi:hypothetical protein
MRFHLTILPLLLILAAGLSTPAGAQESAQTLHPAEVIPLRELQGKIISTAINFTDRFRFNDYTMTGESTQKLRIRLGENGAFETRSARESASNGVVNVLPGHYSGVLGQPGKNAGGRDLLGIYENNVLSLFVVVDVGAGSTIITLKRSPEGLTCMVVGQNMQEVGRGPHKTTGRTQGEKVEVLSHKPLSSTCKVQATAQVNDNDGFWTPRGPGRAPANCLRCTSMCRECKAPEGHMCFEKCRANGNHLVRSDSVCRERGFIPCSAEVK